VAARVLVARVEPEEGLRQALQVVGLQGAQALVVEVDVQQPGLGHARGDQVGHGLHHAPALARAAHADQHVDLAGQPGWCGVTSRRRREGTLVKIGDQGLEQCRDVHQLSSFGRQ
jgi:hypothetical protein